MKRFATRVYWTATALAFSASSSFAVGLGELKGDAFLGEAPKFQIELLGADKPFLDPGCYKLVRPTGDDGLPWLKKGTFSVRTGTSPVLELKAAEALNAPVVNIAVLVGCGQDVVRQYAVLPMPRDARTLAINSPVAPVVAALPSDLENGRFSKQGRSASLPKPQPASTQAENKAALAPVPPSKPFPASGPDAGQDAAEKEKIRQMEAAVGELQQKATDLAQKIEETSKPADPSGEQPKPVTDAVPAVASAEKAVKPALASNSGSSTWSIWAAIAGALVALLAVMWRRHM